MGIPYRAAGRDPGGVDCWGLVLMALRVLGITVPEWTEQRPVAIGVGWQPVPIGEARRGDVVAFRNAAGAVDHVGVVLSGCRFLHALDRAGVVQSQLHEEPWASDLAGAYRYVGLSA